MSEQGTSLSRRSMLRLMGGAGALVAAGPVTTASALQSAGHGERSANSLGQVFHVRDYGAVPDDDVDDTQAIRDAFAAAKDVPGALVIFEPGTYLIEGKEPGWREDGLSSYWAPIFDLRGYEDLRVLGNGAVLQARNWAITFRMLQMQGVEFRDLTIDWARDLPHTEGVVVADTPEYVDVEVNEGFTVRDGLAFSFLYFSLERQRLEQPLIYQHRPGDPQQAPQPCERLSDTVLRCYKSPAASELSFPVGDGIIVDNAISNVAAAFVALASSDVVLRNVTIHTVPGLAIKAEDVHNLSVLNTRIAPPPGRWKSALRGASNTHYISGHMQWRNVEIVRTGDDALNFNGIYYLGQVQPDGRTVVFHYSGGPQASFEDGGFQYLSLYAGDTVELSLPAQIAVPVATIQLAAVDKSRAPDENGVPQNTARLTFPHQLPAEILDAGEVMVLNTSRMPDHAELVDSRIINPRGTFRLRADHTTVRGNEFADMNAAGIQMAVQFNATGGTATGPAAHDVTIENNIFRDTALRRHRGVIVANVSAGGDAPAGTFKNINIIDNQFINTLPFPDHTPTQGPAIWLRAGASDVVIRDNEYVGDWPDNPVRLGGNYDCSTIIIDGEPAC